MESSDRIRIFKFGGTSVRDMERIFRVVELVRPALDEGIEPIVVVSALGGITDRLVDLTRLAADGDEAWKEVVAEVEERHRVALEEIDDPAERERLEETLAAAVRELQDLGRGISLLGECSPRTGDRVLSLGERLSAPLVAAAFRAGGIEAEAHDARQFVITNGSHGAARVLQEETDRRVRERLGGSGPLRVVTGFIGSTSEGETTTLGRGGSDYTATLLGAALDVERVEIWTDVDGIMSADPRLVPDAFPLASVTYDELLELSSFGAKVVAPLAVHPARERNVPLVIRNTLNPDFPGTRVVPRSERRTRNPVRGISTIDRVALVRLENVERVGLAETAERLFGALRRRDVELLMYTQDSSGHNLSFAVAPDQLERVRDAARLEFERERKAGLLGEIVVEPRRSLVAVVGEGMRETPGVAAQLFDVLGEEGVNIHAIAQGSSERNISCVVTSGDEGRTLRAVHGAFFRDPGTVQIFLAGTGSVGSALLEHLALLGDRMQPRPGLHLRLTGIGRSHRAVVDHGGLDPSEWERALDEEGGDGELLFDEVKDTPGPRIFVDCTASEEVAGRYEELLEEGVAIVTANKIALSGSMERYRRLQEAAEAGYGLWYRTTVGAGLPMIRIVGDLRAIGDRVEAMEGVLSGTLAYLLHAVREGRRFSEAVREARDRGLAEPDPREDLACGDVARKLLILAREAGIDLEPDEVCVEPVIPEEHMDGRSLEEFERELSGLDAWFEERSAAAREKGARLVPLARWDWEEGTAEVGLREVPAERPVARIRGTENLLSVTSSRYRTHPVVIQGPGAGRFVTAAQLLADVVEAGTHLVSARRPGRRVARATTRITDGGRR